jgi:NAD(P)-dependent dehydrogenase (short-subunit alcohol dehydrogenase family)
VTTRSRAVLVTGCSSGIGQAIALRLHRSGYPVYASGRRVADLADLAAAGITTLQLDVTDEAAMQAAVKQVGDAHGAVGVLVNNAGYGLFGALEEVPIDAVRAQFATNVFGALRLIQLVLPGMRAQRWGRIVNISSVLGRAAPPGGGAYDASKYAVEGMSDALRLEVAPFGVRTVLIEPGPTRTRFADGAVTRLAGDSAVYADFHRRLAAWHRATGGPEPSGLMGRLAGTPEKVAAAVERAVRARRPRARYPVGILAWGLLAARRALPDTLFDGFVRTGFPAP